MFKRQRTWWLVADALILFILALNFLSFRAARSTTEANHSLSTYRAGETLPDSMASGFTLSYTVSGEERLATTRYNAGNRFAGRIRGTDICGNRNGRIQFTPKQIYPFPAGKPLIRPVMDTILRASHLECTNLLRLRW